MTTFSVDAMSRRTAAVRFAFGLLMAAPALATAQLAPDSPRLISPHGSGGLGVHWLRAETLPRDGAALLVTWAMPGLPDGVRVRGGAGQGAGGGDAIFGGIDFQRPLMRGTTPRPFDLDWQGGIGMSVGDYTLVTLPVGLTGGVSWTSGTVWMAPYVTAGLAADMRIGDQAPAREFEVNTSLDVGLDIAFDLERKIVVRAAAALGDRQAVSLGLAFGIGRLVR